MAMLQSHLGWYGGRTCGYVAVSSWLVWWAYLWLCCSLILAGMVGVPVAMLQSHLGWYGGRTCGYVAVSSWQRRTVLGLSWSGWASEGRREGRTSAGRDAEG